MPIPDLTILNRYEITARAEDFVRAITALAERVARDGHPGVLSYRFFLNRGDKSAQAVIDYDSPEAWIGHHELAMTWPEMKALHSVARLTDVSFLGPLTPEIRHWLESSNLSARIHEGYGFVAGFQR